MKGLTVRPVVLSMLSVILFAGMVFGQANDRGIITGLVTDSSGASVPAATVTVTNQDTSVKTTVASDTAGNYSTPPLVLGTYTVQVEKGGFKTFVRSGIILTSGSQYRQDIALELGAVSQTVEVKAASVMLNAENAEVSHTLTEKYYEDLPAVMGADIRLADGHPRSAHVLKFGRTRSGMLQVANELGEDPRLVRITDCLVPLLDQRLGADLAPRQMMQAHLPQLALVHGQRMLARRPGQLIGDRQDRVKTLFAGHVEISLHLRGLRLVRARLHLDQHSPQC